MAESFECCHLVFYWFVSVCVYMFLGFHAPVLRFSTRRLGADELLSD